MALKYGSSSKSSTFKRSAFPMQSGTANHASALKQEEDARTIEDITKELNLMTAKENLELRKIEIEKSAKKRGKDAAKKELKEIGVKDDQGLYIIGDSEDAEGNITTMSKGARKRAEKKNKEREEEIKIEKATADAKAKVEASRGTHPDQIKKQSKGYYSLDKIQERQDKKFQNKKGKASDKVINKMNKIGTLENKQKKHEPGSKKYNSLQKRIDKNKEKLTKREKKEEKFEGETSSKETKRETRLKKEVGMTPDEYTAYKAEKKEAGVEEMRRAVAGLREYGPGG